MVEVKPVSPFLDEVKVLVEELDHYQSSLYPAESNHLEPVEALAEEPFYFVAAFMDEAVVGTGAVKKFSDYAEIKRLYVPDSFRGQGIAKEIMFHLEEYLLGVGISISRLETGIHQKEALGLYKKLGYREIKAFGSYQPDPLSLFMEKKL